MKIYEFEGFPNPARIRIALAEKGALDQVEFIPVDVPGGEHKSEAFLKKNPSGLVPVLELDDGTQISECTAITEFIDNTFDGPSLCGETPQERAVVHMMQRRAEAQLLDAVSDYFHHATPGLGPDIETYQNKEWGEKRREKALEGMVYLNGVLADKPYLAGEKFSMADISAYAGLLFADFAQVPVSDELTHLAAWRARVADRPST